ncbi:hypothetical protein DMH04_41335 [Kibdelosporangium aridum]|uniref:Uncharacterized protein n=1 Tax=Kibdelosporangium aridum TaxID=2030 RepID=A0A428YUS6_KIBAR|nr:hypothetical protein [Kibdelosporangium aridum]RSM73458.1 hypothetical protein DMH04_41335 [Kibdelosporangium aridum]
MDNDDQIDDTSTEETEVEETETDTDTDADDGAEDLGDKGKRALDAMKGERNAARKQLRETVNLLATALGKTPDQVRAMLKDGQLELPGKKTTDDSADGDVDVDQIRADAQRTADAKANRRIVLAELKAAAAGKLADPADASVFINADEFEVDEHGNVDPDELADAISDLLTKKPHLAAKQATKFGSHDGGPRNGGKKSLSEQIAEAQKAGNHRLAISLKNQLLAEQASKQ